uniref:Uncharacterized protein n=1 Tax=Cacopsylla melanoneura TaxID=428564 RepID=A0A8D8U027_9HEMI
MVYLFKYDSTHGIFKGEVKADGEEIDEEAEKMNVDEFVEADEESEEEEEDVDEGGVEYTSDFEPSDDEIEELSTSLEESAEASTSKRGLKAKRPKVEIEYEYSGTPSSRSKTS